MEDRYFDGDSGINHQETYRDHTGTDNKRSVLSHVISLLKALIGILDIISDSLGKD